MPEGTKKTGLSITKRLLFSPAEQAAITCGLESVHFFVDVPKANGVYSKLSNDIVLPKSYRNLKKILMAAIAIGFGVYNDVLIQSLENNSHWNDLGFEVIDGDCSKAENVSIIRSDKNSPLRLPDTHNQNDIILGYSASDFDDEINYIVQSISDAITEQKLRPDDIAVICLDDRSASSYLKNIAEKLASNGIASNNIQSKNYVKGFALDGRVTLSSVYKAKGNEAAMVFVIGCDVFDLEKDTRIMRNKVFTAFTRAKVWLHITGMNIEKKALMSELQKLKENNYALNFMNKPMRLLDRDWNQLAKRIESENLLLNEIESLLKKSGLSQSDLVELLNKRKDADEGSKE